MSQFVGVLKRSIIWPFNEPLRETLAGVGVAALPKELVRIHKRRVIHDRRPGFLRVLAPSMHALEMALGFLSLALPVWLAFRWKKTEREKDKVVIVYLATIASLFLAGAVATLFAVSLSIYPLRAVGIAATVPLFSLLLLLIAVFVSDESVTLHRALARWERERLAPHHDIPQAMRSRVATLEKLPGVSLEVERLETDPFLVARRRRGLKIEREYVGAWETGDTKLDSF